ncbi:hypothetical protein D3C86_1546560 [compost metagenome]
MVSCKDDLLSLHNRNPAGGFKCLSGFVNHQGMKFKVSYRVVIRANQSCSHYLCLSQYVINDILLCIAYFFHDLMCFIEQRLTLFFFCTSKVTLVFMRHVFELISLLFKCPNLFHARMLRHFAVQG